MLSSLHSASRHQLWYHLHLPRPQEQAGVGENEGGRREEGGRRREGGRGREGVGVR